MRYDPEDYPDYTPEDDKETLEHGYCSVCNGSGEGLHDGSTCPSCKGKGEI